MPSPSDPAGGSEQEALARALAALREEHAAVQASHRALGRRLEAVAANLAALDAQAESARPTGSEPEPPGAPPPTTGPPPLPDDVSAPRIPLAAPSAPPPARPTARIERFVGENLVALVGIGILLLGVGIGVRYAIENDWISPLVRIIAAYLTGAVLVALAEWLRTRDYERLAPILLGGGVAVLYFTTFVAHDSYGLFGQLTAYAGMIGLTAFAVLAALRYDRQVIALLGSVGAYGVPFLLGRDGGDPVALLTYVALVNLGVVAVSYRRTWRLLLYVAFALTWSLFIASTLLADLSPERQLLFGGVFLATFHAAVLLRGIAFAGAIASAEVIVLALNALLGYVAGYEALELLDMGPWLGAFTLAFAAAHLGVAALARPNARLRPSVVPVAAGLTLLFVAVAVPVQLDGPVVTLTWTALGLLLAWLAQRRVEWGRLLWVAGVFGVLALASLAEDYDAGYRLWARPAVANAEFLAGLSLAVAAGVAAYLISRGQPTAAGPASARRATDAVVCAALAVVLAFVVGATEIARYWRAAETAALQQAAGLPEVSVAGDVGLLEQVWQVTYALAFALVLVLGLRRLAAGRGPWAAWSPVAAGLLALATYLTVGLYALSELREAYVLTANDGATAGPVHSWRPGLRYAALALAVGLALALRVALGRLRPPPAWRRAFELAAYGSALWLATAELLHWLDLAGARNQYKLSVSLLWGGFALSLVVVGLLRRRAHLRIAGVALFAVTLVKIFAYDLSSLTTVAKTVVLVALGMLLLVTSFAYTKFQSRLGAADDE